MNNRAQATFQANLAARGLCPDTFPSAELGSQPRFFQELGSQPRFFQDHPRLCTGSGAGESSELLGETGGTPGLPGASMAAARMGPLATPGDWSTTARLAGSPALTHGCHVVISQPQTPIPAVCRHRGI